MWHHLSLWATTEPADWVICPQFMSIAHPDTHMHISAHIQTHMQEWQFKVPAILPDNCKITLYKNLKTLNVHSAVNFPQSEQFEHCQKFMKYG